MHISWEIKDSQRGNSCVTICNADEHNLYREICGVLYIS